MEKILMDLAIEFIPVFVAFIVPVFTDMSKGTVKKHIGKAPAWAVRLMAVAWGALTSIAEPISLVEGILSGAGGIVVRHGFRLTATQAVSAAKKGK